MGVDTLRREPGELHQDVDGFRESAGAEEKIAQRPQPVGMRTAGEKPSVPAYGQGVLSGIGGEVGVVEERRRKAWIEDERASEPGKGGPPLPGSGCKRAHAVLGLGTGRVERQSPDEEAGEEAGVVRPGGGETSGVVEIEADMGRQCQRAMHLGPGQRRIGALERQSEKMVKVRIVGMA